MTLRRRVERAVRGWIEGWRSGVGPGRYRSRGLPVRCARCDHDRFTRAAGEPGNAGLFAWVSGDDWPLLCARCGHRQEVPGPVRDE